MAYSGSWLASNNYTGAAKWGTGIDPIHASRDEGIGRELSVHPGKFADTGTVPDALISEDYGYTSEDYFGGMAEVAVGVRSVPDHPGWDEGYDRSQIPGNYPNPGTNDEVAEQNFEWRSIPHRSHEEAMQSARPILHPVTGGWASKNTSYINKPVTAPAQYEINTSMTQGPEVAVLTNVRAQLRGLPARSPIHSRDVAMRAQSYAKSFEMGGGPDTPRMAPFQQTQVKRPFYYRTATVPPMEQHFMNTAEFRQTQYGPSAVIPDAGVAPDSSATDNYDYSSEDYYV